MKRKSGRSQMKIATSGAHKSTTSSWPCSTPTVANGSTSPSISTIGALCRHAPTVRNTWSHSKTWSIRLNRYFSLKNKRCPPSRYVKPFTSMRQTRSHCLRGTRWLKKARRWQIRVARYICAVMYSPATCLIQPTEKASDPNLTAKSSIFSDKIMDIKSAILQELEAHWKTSIQIK